MCFAAEDAPVAPTVIMSLRALANAFTHKEMGPLLQIHVGTVAAVYAESMKEHGANKMVQVCAVCDFPTDDATFAIDVLAHVMYVGPCVLRHE